MAEPNSPIRRAVYAHIAILIPAIFLLFSFAHVSATLNAEELAAQAPFKVEKELRQFTQEIIESLVTIEFEFVASRIVKNSHLDDPTAQKNLLDFNEKFPGQLATLGSGANTQYIQRSKFGSSFIRYQYDISGTESAIRCMFTYRRKTDGWRLNQLICELRRI